MIYGVDFSCERMVVPTIIRHENNEVLKLGGIF